MSDEQGQDHRQFTRVRARLTTVIKLIAAEKTLRVLTRDVGEIGVCVVLDEALEVGTPLEGEITLPDSEIHVRFFGQVMWSKPLKVPSSSGQPNAIEAGLRFLSIDPRDHSLIMQYAKMNALPPEFEEGAEG